MKLFRTYIVLSLALLITLSATGITISLHRCCGSIKHFSLFGSAPECKMAAKPAPKPCPVKSGTEIKKDSCCNDQQISLNQSNEKTTPATSQQVKEKEQSFDVLFVYTLFKNWFGSSDQDEKDTDKPSPGLFIVEALILLLQQFRI
ncbi:MAG: hypothetical protein H7Y13_12550 [Sphingobacteriaceae bacterium]|nr:hypothetical protein [Sphingobacteriaceae bacterium]